MTRRTILAAMALAGSALTASAQQVTLAESDWNVGCGAEACTLSRSLLAQGGTQRFSTISFSLSASADSVPMAIFVPLGTAVQKPLVLQGGGSQQQYPFTTCLSEGCLVLTKIGLDDLQNFTVLPALNLSFYAAEANTPVSLDFPLDGMAEALEKASVLLQQQ